MSSVEAKHTPEPWPAPDSVHFTGAPNHQLNAGVLSQSDYLRARACVDACAGISTGDLHRNGVAHIIKQRQELLAELRECVTELEAYEAPVDPLDSHNVRLATARATIAKVQP